MNAVYRAGVGEGRHNLEAVVVRGGDDLSVYLGGGEESHVGTIVLCQSRPSLTKDGSLSYTTSVLNILGHKDDGIARPLAEKLCSALNRTVVVTAGVHIDNAIPEDIKQFQNLTEELSDKILDLLR